MRSWEKEARMIYWARFFMAFLSPEGILGPQNTLNPE
jgi:hypothetical protein